MISMVLLFSHRKPIPCQYALSLICLQKSRKISILPRFKHKICTFVHKQRSKVFTAHTQTALSKKFFKFFQGRIQLNIHTSPQHVKKRFSFVKFVKLVCISRIEPYLIKIYSTIQGIIPKCVSSEKCSIHLPKPFDDLCRMYKLIDNFPSSFYNYHTPVRKCISRKSQQRSLALCFAAVVKLKCSARRNFCIERYKT